MPSLAAARHPASWTLRAKLVASMVALFLAGQPRAPAPSSCSPPSSYSEPARSTTNSTQTVNAAPSTSISGRLGRQPRGRLVADADGPHPAQLEAAGRCCAWPPSQTATSPRDRFGREINWCQSCATDAHASTLTADQIAQYRIGLPYLGTTPQHGWRPRLATSAPIRTGRRYSQRGDDLCTPAVPDSAPSTAIDESAHRPRRPPGTLLGLVVVGTGGTFLVRRNLEPLRRLAATARPGLPTLRLDSRERSPWPSASPRADTDPGTEVGQVGLALNGMLDNVDRRLAVRAKESETQRPPVRRRRLPRAPHSPRQHPRVCRVVPQARATPSRPPSTHALGRDGSPRRCGCRASSRISSCSWPASTPGARWPTQPVDLTLLTIDAVSDARAASPDHRLGAGPPRRAHRCARRPGPPPPGDRQPPGQRAHPHAGRHPGDRIGDLAPARSPNATVVLTIA
jgi:two-component system OmpR family sensor kinase